MPTNHPKSGFDLFLEMMKTPTLDRLAEKARGYNKEDEMTEKELQIKAQDSAREDLEAFLLIQGGYELRDLAGMTDEEVCKAWAHLKAHDA